MLNNMTQKEKSLGDKIDSVNGKIDSRAAIKEKCWEIDSKVTALAETAANSAELLLKDLIRVIKQVITI